MIIIIIGLIVILCVVNYNIITTKLKYEDLTKRASEYLYEKYSKTAIFDNEPRYYDSVYFFQNVHFENETTYFQVRYIIPAKRFEDDYNKKIIQ